MDEQTELRVTAVLGALYGMTMIVGTLHPIMNGVTETLLLPGVKLLGSLSIIAGSIAAFRRDRWALSLLAPGLILLLVHATETVQSLRYGFVPYLGLAALLYLIGVLGGVYRRRHRLR